MQGNTAMATKYFLMKEHEYEKRNTECGKFKGSTHYKKGRD